MPTEAELTSEEKVTLNGFNGLYYIYARLIDNLTKTGRPADEADVFFLRGGLKKLLEEYHEKVSAIPIPNNPFTNELSLEYMLPGKTISAVLDLEAKQVYTAQGSLKYLLDAYGGFNTPIPDEVQKIIQAGQEIINNRLKRIESSANSAHIKMSTSVVAFEDLVLKIGTIERPYKFGTIGHYLLENMFDIHPKNRWVNKDNLVKWINEKMGEDTVNIKSVDDKVRQINSEINEKLCRNDEQLFEISGDKIKRNY